MKNIPDRRVSKTHLIFNLLRFWQNLLYMCDVYIYYTIVVGEKLVSTAGVGLVGIPYDDLTRAHSSTTILAYPV